MEKTKTSKVLRGEAAAQISSGVKNRENYENALRLAFEVADRAKLLAESAKAFREQAVQLSELAASYAQEHETALDEPLAERKDGIISGSVTIGGLVYRLTLSKDEFKRISGANLTQGFLQELPRGWTKQKLELNKSKLNGITDADLAEHDLVRPGKALWTRKDAAEGDIE